MESEPINPIKERTDLDHLLDLVISGGWPGALNLEPEDRAYAVEDISNLSSKMHATSMMFVEKSRFSG